MIAAALLLGFVGAASYKSPTLDNHIPANDTQGTLEDMPLLTIAKTWWLSNTRPVMYAYGFDDDLRVMNGFRFCPQLDGSHFDMGVQFDTDMIDTILSHNVSRLAQLKNDKKLARMLSPTLVSEPSLTSGDVRYARNISQEQLVQMIDTVAVVLWQTMLYNQYLASDWEVERHYMAYQQVKQSGDGQFIFQRADADFKFLKSPVDPFEASRRWACFHAADANNAHVAWTLSADKKFLRNVNGMHYFDGTINFAQDEDLRIKEQHLAAVDYQGKLLRHQTEEEQFVDDQITIDRDMYNVTEKHKQKLIKNLAKSLYADVVVQEHRLAYFIMAHGGFTNLINLIQAIWDKHSVILIHVDGKNKILKAQLKKYLDLHPQFTQIFVMKQSFFGLWGQSSLVYCQLAGYFELLSINNKWEYVINLSVNDYPTRHNDVIYQDLKSQCVGECAWIGYRSSIDPYERVYNNPMVPDVDHYVKQQSSDSYLVDPSTLLAARVTPARSTLALIQSALHISENVCSIREVFPYPHWSLYKNDQWMIVSRGVAEHLQRSSSAQYMAAYVEWSFIPDEVYMATVLVNGLGFADQHPKKHFGKFTGTGNIINDSKRYLDFSFGIHPRKLGSPDLEAIVDAVLTRGVASLRKIDIGSSLDGWALNDILANQTVTGCSYESESSFDCTKCALIEEPQLRRNPDLCKVMSHYSDRLRYRDAHIVDDIPKNQLSEMFIHQLNQLRNYDWHQTFEQK